MEKLACVLLRYPAGVDDDDTANFLNQSLLEDLAVTEQILVASNGAEALDLLQGECTQGNCPQLILLDINMSRTGTSVMNGFEFLDAYEQLEIAHKQSVVIVMLTTSLNPIDMHRLGQVPAVGFLNKPLTEPMVRHLLRQYFHRELPK